LGRKTISLPPVSRKSVAGKKKACWHWLAVRLSASRAADRHRARFGRSMPFA
jgi:hypothetical protein